MSLVGRLLECHRTGNLERQFRRVHFVVLAVEQNGSKIDHGITGQYSSLHCLPYAILDRRDEITRDRPAFSLVGKFEAGSLGQWLEPQVNHPELPMAARLPDKTPFSFGHTPNSLPVSYLRLADVRVNLELAQHPVDDDFEV